MTRKVLAIAAAVLLLAALAAAVIGWITGEGPGPPRPSEVAQPTPALPPAAPPLQAPPAPTDPAVLRREADLAQARARYRSLRESFGAGRVAGAGRARLDPALRTLAGAGSARWTVWCNGLLCRIEAPDGPGEWQSALRESEAVKAVADRIETDPDGVEGAAFLVLAEPRAADGAAVLAALERKLQESPEAARCLAEAPQKGAVRIDLELDTSGVTYQTSGDLPWPVVQCLGAALTDAITRTEVPAAVRSAARSITLRTPP